MAKAELGTNYTIEEDSNGDLVIKDGTNGDILKYDRSADELNAEKSFATDRVTTNDRVAFPADYGGASDVGEAFNNARTEYGIGGVIYEFPAGAHNLSTATNFTQINGADERVAIDLRGTILNIQSGLSVAMDAIGSQDGLTIWGGKINGGNNNPDVGLLVGDADRRERTSGSTGLTSSAITIQPASTTWASNTSTCSVATSETRTVEVSTPTVREGFTGAATTPTASRVRMIRSTRRRPRPSTISTCTAGRSSPTPG